MAIGARRLAAMLVAGAYLAVALPPCAAAGARPAPPAHDAHDAHAGERHAADADTSDAARLATPCGCGCARKPGGAAGGFPGYALRRAEPAVEAPAPSTPLDETPAPALSEPSFEIDRVPIDLLS